MSKVRINDLARELEVKSKSILDALTAVGVTEKKTHSSSLEEDEAARVRTYLRGGAPSSGARSAAASEPKIDLSRISKPGDALKAILERKQAEQQAHSRPPAAPPPPQRPAVAAPPQRPAVATPPRPGVVVTRPSVAPPVATPPAVAPAASTPAAPAAPAAPTAPRAPAATSFSQQPAAPRRIMPQMERRGPQIIAPKATPPAPAIAGRPPAGPVVAAPRPPIAGVPPAGGGVAARPAATPAGPAAAAPAVTAAHAAPAEPMAAAPVAPETPASTPAPAAAAPAAPAAPARRVIMPQTGPRPTYTAPVGAANLGIQRGRPIFERPRPSGPGGGGPSGPGGPGGGGGRPPMRPGERRPMHPTRTHPTGGPGGGRPGFGQRPGFGGGQRPGGAPGMLPPPGDVAAPSNRPGGQRPGGNRRGQQYEKSKEGPMKGFNAPRFGGMPVAREPVPITKNLTVTEGISVKDLAEKLEVRGKDLIASLLMKGVFVTVNQSLDNDLVKDVSRQFGADVSIISVEEQLENEAIEGLLEDTSGMVEIVRPPVVTVMGHVDHGKTSLLDALRETDVASGEAGGITQHIGAYKVHVTKEGSPAFGREIVFLDTPGHEAFTRMRARGAKVTDIVVVVVAADDGVMPQTLEAIDHARAAKVPIIVAVNKIDKPEANPDRVMQQLADRGLQPDSWGGDTPFVQVSAKKRINLDGLEEMICLVADTNEQKATPERPAVGTVIEAKLDRGRGAVASILVQNGTLRVNDSYIVGNTFGKVRAMFDDRGRSITEAGPSTPVEILGLEGIPDAGDTFLVMADRDKAKGIAQYRKMKEREAQLAKSSRVSLEGLAEQIKQAGVKDLNIILKGDVQGSVEVLADSLQRMSTEKVRVKVLHSGVGSITESDVLLATASNAIIIGFNVRPERKAAELAEQENVQIRMHSIIYELQDEITKAMYGLLEPVYREQYEGRAEVLSVFKISKVGQIAGCTVRDGVIHRNSQVRVKRDGEEVWKGKLTNLKRFKDDVSDVREGYECGIDVNFKDIKAGDMIEAYTTEKIAAELGANTAELREAAAKAAATHA
ncbi:translation initiation factor IF-2 [Terriglobus sp. 2YAB30_2]|uniref:translation initiation factor IF-2 n=1 Tax=unclassified Terriglobus TaxID=2628988 RepID=UPI003F9C28CB